MRTVRFPTARPAAGPAFGGFRDPRAVAVWGALYISLTAVLIRLADVAPATAVFYRCLLALPPLAFLALREHRAGHGLSRRAVARYAVAGSLLGVDFALWSQSILLIGAGISTVLVNVQVVVVPLFSFLIFRTRIPMRFVVSVPVLFAGIALAAGLSDGASAGPDLAWGAFLALLSGVAYAGYIFIVGRSGSAETAAAQVLVSTAAAGVVGSAVGSLWGPVDLAPGWSAFGWLLVLALSAQFLGWIMLGRSLPRLAPEVGATLLLLQPVLAIAAAMVVLGERPTLPQLVGCTMVIGAAWFVSIRPVVSRKAVPLSEIRHTQ
ncbi:DMT family transporter [Rhodococcus sp. AG1013]|uniref:DMT family transporter n=1 Tax=unclassified Rhodococcus (in: high G+C Gram-positive bacteria) TaxID=192944 RepID=UPI000E0B410C|nr:DMT family transporter [Rhodococcus sp. AG1013]RDI28177.1 EamA-like transporter family protein [Rhodococcus sp. AG1013]